jgi:hypothetical protein
VYHFSRLTGSERFRLGARVLENPRALPGGCAERCGKCDDCLKLKFDLWSSLCEPNAAVYSIENGTGPRAVLIWLGNEMHGHAWDGRLLDKTEVVRELVEDRLREYHMVRMTVPADSRGIARWSLRLGFRLGYIKDEVYHLWRVRDGIRR